MPRALWPHVAGGLPGSVVPVDPGNIPCCSGGGHTPASSGRGCADHSAVRGIKWGLVRGTTKGDAERGDDHPQATDTLQGSPQNGEDSDTRHLPPPQPLPRGSFHPHSRGSRGSRSRTPPSNTVNGTLSRTSVTKPAIITLILKTAKPFPRVLLSLNGS